MMLLFVMAESVTPSYLARTYALDRWAIWIPGQGLLRLNFSFIPSSLLVQLLQVMQR